MAFLGAKQEIRSLREQVTALQSSEQLKEMKAAVQEIQQLSWDLDSLKYSQEEAARLPKLLEEARAKLAEVKQMRDLAQQLRSN